jgi:hypothetical protein
MRDGMRWERGGISLSRWNEPMIYLISILIYIEKKCSFLFSDGWVCGWVAYLGIVSSLSPPPLSPVLEMVLGSLDFRLPFPLP